jgi:hypothetical protein
MIEPTVDMATTYETARRAYFVAQDHTAVGLTVAEHHQAACLAGLAAVFALVERDYCLEPPGHASRSPRPKWPLGRGGSHPHYCVSCSDGVDEGPGCMNCRWTGMDQTPWPNCEACP